MLVFGSKMLNCPVMSLHIGGEVAQTERAIIDPNDLNVIAYTLSGPLLNDPEIGTILDMRDAREIGQDGIIIDSSDCFVKQEDVIRINDTMKLNFDLIGLKVVTKQGKKLGKVIDYTYDAGSMMVYQIIVQRPFMQSMIDPQLTINRSQIIEIDDYKLTVKHDKEQVKVPEEKKKETEEEFVPNYSNPFKRPGYAPSNESSASDNSSNMSE